MSGSDRPNDTELSRRTFVKGVGATAGVGLLGLGTTGAAAADSSIDDRFLNWRAIEARKVWDRGYRGRPDRTVGLTDSGIEARHPDLGPWNGISPEIIGGTVAIPTGEGGELPETTPIDEDEHFEGTIGAGTFLEPTMQQEDHDFYTPEGYDDLHMSATMEGEPDAPDGLGSDNELYLDKNVGTEEDPNWQRIAISTNPGSHEELSAYVEGGGAHYRFVVESWISWPYDYVIDAQYSEYDGEVNIAFGDEARALVFGDLPSDPGEITPDTPKTVGWFGNENAVPRDGNGHGTHVSGIMAGSGRASTMDAESIEVHEPNQILLPTEFVEYETEADAGTHVFASAFGTNVTVSIVGPDGRQLRESPMENDSIVIDVPTQDDEYHADGGSATYTIRVKPWETQRATGEAAEQAQSGDPTVGRLERIAVGAYEHQDDTVGARRAGEEVMHPGIAPNQSLVGIQGLSDATSLVGMNAPGFASVLNMRAVNMSWGWIGGAPLGVAGGETDFGTSDAVKNMAVAGILPVSAAGNSYTPANSGSPATVGESISVVATGPFDGITSYSSGGVAAADADDKSDVYGKPDVTAPGGDAKPDGPGPIAVGTADANVPVDLNYPAPSYLELVRAAKTADPDADLPADEPRDHTSKGGTSMASPYVCGVTALVSEAMDVEYGDAPESITLPTPPETTREDVLRLKQVILATANETAFTAAPYHSAKNVPNAPTYDFGDRDPWEGYGRVNPDAAVDAVTRNLLPAGSVDPETGDEKPTSSADPGAVYGATYDETVGLYVPEDSRAVAGYVEVRGGSLDVAVDFSHYSGGNRGMTKGDPHLDLFVYDAEQPADFGEPNVVASAQGLEGDASVSVDVERRARRTDEHSTRTFLVVAKIVNVPGVVNGFDVRAHFDLDVSYVAAEQAPLPDFTASGSRADDGRAFTAGQTNKVDLTVDSLDLPDDVDLPADTEVDILDASPWEVYTSYFDAESYDAESGEVTLTSTTVGEIENGPVRRSYTCEAPNDLGSYEFGAAEVVVSALEEERDTAAFGGTDTNYVVAPDQNEPVGSTSQGASSATDGGSSTTGGVTDTVEDTL